MLRRILAACRYLLVVPVIGCVLLTAGVVVMGFGRIVTAGYRLAVAGDFSAKAAKTMSLAVIEIIDLFLIGTVSYIAAVGLYKLFIDATGVRLPMRQHRPMNTLACTTASSSMKASSSITAFACTTTRSPR